MGSNSSYGWTWTQKLRTALLESAMEREKIPREKWKDTAEKWKIWEQPETSGIKTTDVQRELDQNSRSWIIPGAGRTWKEREYPETPIPDEHLPIPSQGIPQNPLEYSRNSGVLSESQPRMCRDPAAKFQARNPRILAPLLQSEPFNAAFGCRELFGNGFQEFCVYVFFHIFLKEDWSGSKQIGSSRYFWKSGIFPFSRLL